MTYTKSELIYDGLSEIRELRYGKATAGNTTSLTDTNRPSGEPSFVNGTLFVIKTTDGAAPQGEFSRITAVASNVFTLADTLTAAIDAGDRYGIATPTFDVEELQELANDAIQRIDIAAVDTSLTTANNQTEYSLPVALKQMPLLSIEVQGLTTDANDNRPLFIDNFRVRQSAAGSVGTLILPQLPSDRTIYITYVTQPGELVDFDDPVPEVIHRELAVASFVERLTNRLIEKTKNSARPFAIGYDKAKEKYERMLTKHPTWVTARRPRMTIVGHSQISRDFTPDIANL